MKGFFRDNALGLAFGAAFLLALSGQSAAGTIWLFQRGSPESKPFHQMGKESDRDQQVGRHVTAGSPPWVKAGGWRAAIFSRSLGILMGTIFVLCWLAQSVAGWAAYNSDQLTEREDPVDWLTYVGSADFWNRTLQNWQSELLAVGSFAVLAVFLRQRGSPESKPVGAEHGATATSG